MIRSADDFQKISQQGLDTTMRTWSEWSRGWQAIAAEMTDYTKRSFEDGTATWERLASARTFEQAVEIQTGYAKRAYEDYMTQMSRIGSLYAEMARDAYKPFEQAQNGSR